MESPAGSKARGVRFGLVKIFPRQLEEPAEVWCVDKPLVLGRGPDADIRIRDPRLSRHHARVEPRGSAGWAVDLNSSHGTFLNGRNLSGAGQGEAVRRGSVLRVGDTFLLVVADAELYRGVPRRVSGKHLGLARDILAGPTLVQTWDQATRVASLPHAVLVLGESGSGKENIARIVHVSYGRGPFVGINVAAIPEGLFEAELFGHERGAFTGAVGSRIGAFREADGGVLFLDEIGDLRMDLQAKLLRAIDLQRVRPVGGSKDIEVDVRLVAATSTAIQDAVTQGKFRRDLYYRLSGTVLCVPPLRERPDDVVLLALDVLAQSEHGHTLSPGVVEALLMSSWEGNVRQLRHAIMHAMAEAVSADRKEIIAQDLPSLDVNRGDAGGGPLTEERIRGALRRTNGVVTKAAALLGVSRAALYKRCKRMGIGMEELRTDGDDDEGDSADS